MLNCKCSSKAGLSSHVQKVVILFFYGISRAMNSNCSIKNMAIMIPGREVNAPFMIDFH